MLYIYTDQNTVYTYFTSVFGRLFIIACPFFFIYIIAIDVVPFCVCEFVFAFNKMDTMNIEYKSYLRNATVTPLVVFYAAKGEQTTKHTHTHTQIYKKS